MEQNSALAQPGTDTGVRRPVPAARVRRWSAAVIAANVVFVAAWLLAASWQGPRYSVTAHTISDTYASGAPGAAFLIVVFTLCGAAVLMFTWRALWPSLRQAGRPAAVGATLLSASIFGLGDLLTPFEREGCRLADPGCTSAAQLATAGGTLDAVLSTAGVAALVAAGFFLAAAMAGCRSGRAGPAGRAGPRPGSSRRSPPTGWPGRPAWPGCSNGCWPWREPWPSPHSVPG